MPDLQDSFDGLRRELDAAQPPDMLADAFHRAPSMGEPDGPSPWRRVGIITLALVIAATSTFFAITVFDREQSGLAGKADVLPYPLAYSGSDVHDPNWGRGELWLMDEAGQRTTLVSVPGVQTAVPAWSPDGSQIAFAAELDDLGTQIWVINADGTDLREVTTMVPREGPGAVNDAPAWSPDGTQIAFNCYDGSMHEVCLVYADGSGDPRKLTDGINVAHDTPPLWLGPNELMFSTFGSAGCGGDGPSCDEPATGGTFTLSVDGGKPTRVGTARPQVTLSPTRDRIAFLCPTIAGYAICTERTDLTGREQVTSPPTDRAAAITDSDSFPAWLPDGRLSFVRESRAFDGFHLYIVDAHGGQPTELANLGSDVRGFGWGPAPSQSEPEPTASTEPHKPEGAAPLDLLWSHSIVDTASPAEVLMDGERIYVPTATGVVAYPVDCSSPCEPLWHGDVGSGISGPSVAAGDGIVVVVDPAKGAWVFDGDCATDGSECEPRWSVQPGPGEHFGSPSIDNGIVRLTGGTGDAPDQHVRVLAFPADCSGGCAPAWTADEGTGTIYASVTNLEGVGYQQVGMAVYGFRSDCRSDGGACTPDLQIQASGDPSSQSSSIYGPVGDSSVVVFSAGDGNLYGYAPHCGQSCSPTWVGSAGNYIEAIPVLYADLVYITASDGIFGFPLLCEGQCEPVMRADLGDYHAIEGADAQGLIAVSHFGRRPQIVALPPDCAGTCEPSWTASPGGDIYGVLAQESFVAVGSSGDSMETYPRACSDACQPSEQFSIGGEAWWMFVAGDRLVVGARSGDVSSAGLTLSVFQIT